jgi:glycerophosphoryl diester phosphodiesterase
VKRQYIALFILLFFITVLYKFFFDKSLYSTEISINEVLTSNQVYNNKYFINKLTGTSYVAHRGAVSKKPENSLPAFRTTKEMGYTIVETDLQLTKDSEWILMHDYTLDRTTTGKGQVKDYTLNRIKKLKLKSVNGMIDESNSSIPTLDEFLKLCYEQDLSPILDIKPNENQISQKAYLNLMNSLKKYNLLDETIICSYSKGVLSQIRRMEDNITIAVMMEVTEDNLEFAQKLNNSFIYYNYKKMSEDKLNLIREKNLKYGVWTVDGKEDADYFKNRGSIMIVTDALLPEKNN